MVEEESVACHNEVTTFLKLPVYTREGYYVGYVKNVFLDIDEKRVNSLLVTNTNPRIVENSVDVSVPYRWVNAVGDIVILSTFPERVVTHHSEKEEEEEKETKIDMID